MNWAVVLGPDDRAIPDEKWDEYREKGLICVWDVYCKKAKGQPFPHYVVYLRSRKGRFLVGHTIFHRGWSAFGSHGFMPVEGFARRRYAIEYMLKCRGFQNIR